MKFLLPVFGLLFSSLVFACAKGEMQVWSQASGAVCVKKFRAPYSQKELCLEIENPEQNALGWLETFPRAFRPKKETPWWALAGEVYFPNLPYPGAWKNNGVDGSFYPGTGEVHALKPNIYVESIHPEKKFSFSFTSKEELSFLSTTPALEKNTWTGKIINFDQFEVDGIRYDYLFYDIRLPKDKMQFEHGVCVVREEAVKWMLQDLKAMNYPAIALQDFEEHWKVKIPEIPFYCIYPQYNKQIDEILPVSISLEQVRLTRSLYVLVPHSKEPDASEQASISLPTLDPKEVRPVNLIKYENMFKEWGVAFIEE